ncbi:MAG: neutral/alkaline non-lysosomal ceramidase N-terminal domain-containing protein [Bacteroidota bacterium]
MLKKIFKVFGFTLAVILGALAFCLAPIDWTPYQQMPYYQEVKAHLRALAAKPKPQPISRLQAGWAKVNMTPAYATPTAGYGGRKGKPFESVHDSVYARALVLDNGALRVAIVSLDLLIVPPTVTAQLKEKLPNIGFSLDRTYLAATHSHNSLGGWGKKLAGKLFAGKYEQRMVDHLTQAILTAIDQAQKQLAPAQVGFSRMAAPAFVFNRLVGKKGITDPWIRTIKLKKSNGQTALLCTYAAHATCLDMYRMQLSRDYPGVLVDALEKKDSISVDFAMFMAGAVGSQGPVEKGNDQQAMDSLAYGLNHIIEAQLNCIPMQPDTSLILNILRVPLPLREPQRKISANWRIRPWLFNAIYGSYPSEMKALRIGQQILVGTPCDFSGELVPDFDSLCRQKGINLLITSFNGGYVGYITPDAYYELNTYETNHMNWFGPYNAAYFEEVMKELISINYSH